jgi:hypothetical protein
VKPADLQLFKGWQRSHDKGGRRRIARSFVGPRYFRAMS